MPAALLHRERFDFDDGAVLEMVLWQISELIPGSPHRYKYRLYYGRADRRIVGYDNERGKGDHRHRRGREESCHFTTVDQLIADFLADVAEERTG